MKKVNQILSVLLGMIFFVSSTGVMIYKTHCSCTGDEQLSIYVMPETCEKDFHLNHSPNPEGNETETNEICCHECTPLTHDCGCNAPEIRFFKLMNEISNDEVSYVYTPTFRIAGIILTEFFNLSEIPDIGETLQVFTDPPPKITSSRSFLIQVHQLKIPFKA